MGIDAWASAPQALPELLLGPAVKPHTNVQPAEVGECSGLERQGGFLEEGILEELGTGLGLDVVTVSQQQGTGVTRSSWGAALPPRARCTGHLLSGWSPPPHEEWGA